MTANCFAWRLVGCAMDKFDTRFGKTGGFSAKGGELDAGRIPFEFVAHDEVQCLVDVLTSTMTF